MGRDYYAILGVSKTAEADELKKGAQNGEGGRPGAMTPLTNG